MERRPAGSSDRAFGFVFAAFFGIVGLLPLFSRGEVRGWALFISLAFALYAAAVPHVLAPLNRAWTAFGEVLHHIVSPIALGILYYGVVTPTGLLMRLAGKDPLRLRPDPAARSYWIERQPPGPPADSLKDQF
jgi:hypothetical protein